MGNGGVGMNMKWKFKVLSAMLITILTLSIFTGVNIKKVSAVTKGPDLLITEIMPLAKSGDDSFEYIEIYNNTNQNIDLKHYKFINPDIDINTSKILPSRGMMVVCLNNSATLNDFNTFYGKQLTSDSYLNLACSKDVLPSTGEQYVILSKDDNNVICYAGYTSEDFGVKQSVGYKYPEDGMEMIKFGQKQLPTPGEVNIDQVPYTQIPVAAVRLNTSNAEINVGGTLKLISTIIPTNSTNKNVTWTSSKPGVAQVLPNGLVYGVNQGTAIITVKTVDGGKSASCIVTVRPADTVVYVQNIKLEKTAATLESGKTLKLNAQIIPSNATDKKIIWTSNNPGVAAVNHDGEVTARSAGAAIITASTPDSAHRAICIINVVTPQNIGVTGVNLNKSILTLRRGLSETLVASILPQNASDKRLTWKSENNNVAIVDQNGKVTAVREGVTIITVKTQDGGYIAACEVIVKGVTESVGKVTGVKLNHCVLIIKDDKLEKLAAIVEPGNAVNKKVRWESSNKDVAEVLQDGRIIAKSEGVAEITATTEDGGYKAKCIVVVFKDKAKGNNGNGYGNGKGHKK